MDAKSLTARGGDWASLQAHLGWVYEGPVLSHGRTGSFEPYYMGAWLIISGSAAVRRSGVETTAKAGQWLIPWPGFHQQEFTPDAKILSVRFRAHWPDGKPLFEHGLSTRFRSAEHPEMEVAARRLLKIARRYTPAHPDRLAQAQFPIDDFIAMQTRLLEFVGVFAHVLIQRGLRPNRLGIRDERVLQALAWLDRHALSERFLEEELAARVGLGPSQLVRLFRREVGVTPKRYFESRRRSVSARLLADSATPIKQIASDLGFAHLSDFSLWFKTVHGLSPRSFRLNIAENKTA